MVLKRALVGIVCYSLFILPLQAQSYSASLYQTILSMAQRKDTAGLVRLRTQYGTLDYVDSTGLTPLCRSFYAKDYTGYATLIRAGADRNHACMQQISANQKKIFNQEYQVYYPSDKNTAGIRYTRPASGIASSSSEDISPMVWGVGAVAGIGAVAALAFSGGGGSSSSGGGSGKGDTIDGDNTESGVTPNIPQLDNPNTGDNTGNGDNTGGGSGDNTGGTGGTEGEGGNTPVGDKPYTLRPMDFETSEYRSGKFLPQIKASAAYARFYTATQKSDGTVTLSTSRLSPVKVAVIDEGVFKHTDLKNNLLGGYNYDYGPCRSSSSRNCWVYKETGWISKTKGYAFRDSNGKESDVIWETSQAQFNAWAAAYPTNYTWSANWYNAEPLTTIGDYQHGTHVAGIIAAEKNKNGMHGVAPNARIIPIRYDFLSGLSNPIKTAVDAGAKVINASLGTSSTSEWNAQTALSNTSAWKDALSMDLDGYRYLSEKQSTVLVVSAGNEGQNQPSLESGAGLVYPNLKKVMIVVAAVGLKDPTHLASYSNKCGVAAGYCLVAPGGDGVSGSEIISTIGSGNNIGGMSGTSMAAPVVSGAVAFLMGAYPNLSASQVVSLLFETATDLGDAATFGHGLINMDAATAPVGKTSLALTQDVNGARRELAQTKLRIPAVFYTQLSRRMPAGISVLDKYDRSFIVPTSQFVHSTYRDTDAFKNALHRFVVHKPVRRVQADSKISFGFSKAAKTDSELGLGAMDVLFQLNNHDVRFYYVEDSLFGSGEYFDQALINPFTAMNEAYGINDTYRLNPKLNLKMGFITGQNGLFQTDTDQDSEFEKSSYAFESGIDFIPIEGISFGLLGGLLQEKDALLGMNGSGAFDIKNSQTYYVGLSTQIKPIKGLTLSGAYYYGMTNGAQHNSFMRTGRLVSEGFSADIRWTLNKTDYMGFQMISPLRIKNGYAAFDLPVGRDYYTDTIYRESIRADLKPSARETDWAFYYTTEINPAMHFKTQTGVRLHPDHQSNARPDYQVLIGFDWQFNAL